MNWDETEMIEQKWLTWVSDIYQIGTDCCTWEHSVGRYCWSTWSELHDVVGKYSLMSNYSSYLSSLLMLCLHVGWKMFAKLAGIYLRHRCKVWRMEATKARTIFSTMKNTKAYWSWRTEHFEMAYWKDWKRSRNYASCWVRWLCIGALRLVRLQFLTNTVRLI